MVESQLEELKYPIGKFKRPSAFSKEAVQKYITTIEAFPAKIRLATATLNDTQLDTCYRPEGWTIRQVVHHVADSHLNAYCRFKLAVTEDRPVIKPYIESRWAETHDGKTAPVWVSLNLLDALHFRWVLFLKSLDENDYDRIYFHPEQNREVNLYEALASYDWHCDHHLGHITSLKKRKGW
jgi:hypothetical protein